MPYGAGSPSRGPYGGPAAPTPYGGHPAAAPVAHGGAAPHAAVGGMPGQLVTITGTQECNQMALYMLYSRLG